MNLDELEREVIRLEDIQAIEDLQQMYGYYMDSHHRQEVIGLFSDYFESKREHWSVPWEKGSQKVFFS